MKNIKRTLTLILLILTLAACGQLFYQVDQGKFENVSKTGGQLEEAISQKTDQVVVDELLRQYGEKIDNIADQIKNAQERALLTEYQLSLHYYQLGIAYKEGREMNAPWMDPDKVLALANRYRGRADDFLDKKISIKGFMSHSKKSQRLCTVIFQKKKG